MNTQNPAALKGGNRFPISIRNGDVEAKIYRTPTRIRGKKYDSYAGVRSLVLAELFRAESGWPAELRVRCVPKLKSIRAPRPEAVFDKDVTLDVFTLSPTGLQIYFNPYAIASGADGEFVVHFDYGELKDLLRTDGPARLLPR